MRFSALDGAAVGVWGAGREIRSFAAHLARRLPRARIAVVALDSAPAGEVEPGARVVTGAEIVPALLRCDVVVRSPGVSIHRPELREVLAAGVPVTTATGLWLAEREGGRVIGVTGTKGKSTTAALAFHLARASGEPVYLAGNIGAPALDLLDTDPAELAVVELSSYQIADLETGPELAVVTNLFPEHVDWHGSEEVYRAEKLRILGLPGVRAAVVNARDERLVAAASGVPCVTFGAPDGWDAGSAGIARAGTPVLAQSELPLRGEHNALNLCAALTALETAHIALPPLPAALSDFRGLRHRLEIVADIDGVLWVDDSISTTPESALAALASFPGPIVLLGGGHDRGQDYAELGRALAERNAAVIGLPATGGRLLEAARRAGVPASRAVEAPDLEAAVVQARAFAQPGTTVLLSPAAPSYNAYVDFEERGDHFRALAVGS